MHYIRACVSNAGYTDFCLFIALGNKMEMARLFYIVNNIYFMLKKLCLKQLTDGVQPTLCFLKSTFLGVAMAA